MTPRIMLVAGTRPELIKLYPVMSVLRDRGDCETNFVWTGQHYDENMSDIFFKELDIPKPDVDLDIGGSSASEQCAKIGLGLGREIERYSPNIVLAEGDTNTVAEASLSARRGGVPFGHIEAGLRSFDRRMPEEFNRRIAGVCADLNYAPTVNAALNLIHEGIGPSRIFVTGNTVVDTIAMAADKIGFREMAGRFGFDPDGKNILVTLHRAENVDDPTNLRGLVKTIGSFSEHGHIIFPVHPRTAERLKAGGLMSELRNGSITITEPMGYLDFLSLEKESDLIVTDSGGVQEEALVLGTPTVTLRYNTERPETVWAGSNYVAGTTPDHKVVDAMMVRKNRNRLNIPNVLGDGKAGRRISEITVSKIVEGLAPTTPDFRESGSAVYRLFCVGKAIRVSEIVSQAEGVEVLAVYDAAGGPILPYGETELTRGMMVLVIGGAPTLEKVAEMLRENEIIKRAR